jgi:hypothetical protein
MPQFDISLKLCESQTTAKDYELQYPAAEEYPPLAAK